MVCRCLFKSFFLYLRSGLMQIVGYYDISIVFLISFLFCYCSRIVSYPFRCSQPVVCFYYLQKFVFFNFLSSLSERFERKSLVYVSRILYFGHLTEIIFWPSPQFFMETFMAIVVWMLF